MNFVQAAHYTPAKRTAIDLVVIHTAECLELNTAGEGVANYFAGASAPLASAHYVVDVDSVTQCVREQDIAWHAGPVNGFSIGVEHAGFASQTTEQWADKYSMAMLIRSLDLVADICKRYDIPAERLTAADLQAGKRRGLCGHVDVTNGLTKGVGHWDPGPAFPWEWYLDQLRLRGVGMPKDAPKTDWVEVECNGVAWSVAPSYIAPVGIGEAVTLANNHGCELPSPDLVNAIWERATLKLSPIPLSPNKGNDAAQFAEHRAKVMAQIADRPFELLAGTHKDVVIKDGKIGLYGWHRPDGSIIQPFYAGHSPDWKDYSQGLRLVKRVKPDLTTVRGYQTRLAQLGYGVGKIDGVHGPLTEAAVRAFQRDHGLVVDGRVGPKTIAAMS